MLWFAVKFNLQLNFIPLRDRTQCYNVSDSTMHASILTKSFVLQHAFFRELMQHMHYHKIHSYVMSILKVRQNALPDGLGWGGTQYYKMHHVKPKRSPFFKPTLTQWPLGLCIATHRPPSSVTQRPSISDLSPKDPQFLILSPKNPSF